MDNDKINILLIGDNGASSALAKKLAKNENVGEIYVTSQNDEDWECFKKIDLRDDDLTGLLVFALENNINLTVPTSEKALKSDVVSFFQSNGQNIFGPTKNSCKIFLDNILCKKFLYRIKAQIPKFGIYNKLQLALDYLNRSTFPAIIKTAENSTLQDDRFVCTTIKSAQNFLENIFAKGETDVLVEDFIYGHDFTVYFVTDGYCAIPLNTVGNYKFLENERCGQYFDGVGCYCPDYKISEEVIYAVGSIAQNILSELDMSSSPYMGILGIECILTGENTFIVKDLKPFLQDYDAPAVLNLTDDDIVKIMYSCINGFFADEYEYIKNNDYASAALCLYSKYKDKEIGGLNDLDDIDFINVKRINDKYYTKEGLNFCITKTASTLSRAKEMLNEEISDIVYDGKKYRKDVCANSSKDW